MADDGIQSLVTNFVSVTGSDEERAKFYLNASNWDLNSAIAAFFDSDSGDISEPVSVPSTENRMSDKDFVDDESSMSTEKSKPKGQSKRPSNQSNSRFATLSSYKNDDSSSDGEEGQTFYAGGSETSGQQIVGPNKKKKDFTQGIFEAAKSHGAQAVTGDEPRKPKSSNAFSGAGFTLGSNVDPSKQIGNSLAGAGAGGSSNDSNEKPKTTVIKFWQNGFSVDDGPLRDPSNPENTDFMDSIKRGEVPNELRQFVRGNEIHVNMEDHRTEDYVKPKENVKAFTGAGYTLGSPSPNVVVKQEEQPIGAPSAVPSRPAFKVDESKPSTTIQIRLADGTRLVTKFNTHNTIGDIRNVVQNAKPGQSNFKLMTTFPNKELVNDDQTIEDAKLKNAVIVQRMA